MKTLSNVSYFVENILILYVFTGFVPLFINESFLKFKWYFNIWNQLIKHEIFIVTEQIIVLWKGYRSTDLSRIDIFNFFYIKYHYNYEFISFVFRFCQE